MPGDLFSEAETHFRALTSERRARRLNVRDFRRRVRELAVRDSEGREWVLGPEDGLWYRRDRGRWVSAEPPRRRVCPACAHHNLMRHYFCVQCGAVLGNLDGVEDGLAQARTS